MQAFNPSIRRKKIQTIQDLFRNRVSLTPDKIAYQYRTATTKSWNSITWQSIFQKVLHVRNALSSEKLNVKDRILIALPNSIEWVIIEQAAHELGLIPVSIPANSAANTIHHIATETDAKLLFLDNGNIISSLNSYENFSSHKRKTLCINDHALLADKHCYKKWLMNNQKHPSSSKHHVKANSLATIIYTSGTTGKPKGVMLSHEALLNNAFASIEKIDLNENDRLLSVTPISHCMERIAGYYSPMITGATVCFPNNSNDIKTTLTEIKPTIMVTTPSLLVRAYDKTTENGALDNFGNFFGFINKNRVKKRITKSYFESLRYIFTGGAKLPDNITSLCKKLSLPVIEGYGLTEAGGIVSSNLPLQNQHGSIGRAISNAKIHFSNDGEILVSSNSIMLGYWKNPGLTQKVLRNEILFTNDIGEIREDTLFIHGRKQHKIHLSTGEKLSPLPIEQRIKQDNLFKYAMIYGESRDKLAVICSLNRNVLKEVLAQKIVRTSNSNSHELKAEITRMISVRLNTIIKQVPNHLPIEVVISTLDSWTEENGLLNAKGKINRHDIEQRYMKKIESAYANAR